MIYLDGGFVFKDHKIHHFEGGLYEATLTFPEDFPHMPPKMLFKTEMFHPNSILFLN
jgi:ubiquitin-conjugating enzyme E2 G1